MGRLMSARAFRAPLVSSVRVLNEEQIERGVALRHEEQLLREALAGIRAAIETAPDTPSGLPGPAPDFTVRFEIVTGLFGHDTVNAYEGEARVREQLRIVQDALFGLGLPVTP